MKTIYLKDFTRLPGGRTRSVNKNAGHSGEEWREQVLVPELKAAIERDEILNVNLDDVAGWPASFLDASFADLLDHFSFDNMKKYLQIECKEDPRNVAECWEYIAEHDEWLKNNGGCYNV